MIKKAITISFIIPAVACGPDTIVVIPQESVDLPVTELEYIEAPSIDEEEPFYAERIVFEEAVEEEPAQEEEPVQEEPPVEEEEVTEEEPAQEEEPVEVEEESIEEETAEEEPVETEEELAEEEPAEEPSFSGECNLEGNIYNFLFPLLIS